MKLLYKSFLKNDTELILLLMSKENPIPKKEWLRMWKKDWRNSDFQPFLKKKIYQQEIILLNNVGCFYKNNQSLLKFIKAFVNANDQIKEAFFCYLVYHNYIR